MALYCYFKLADDVLPSPTRFLSSSVSLATIRAANETVKGSALTPSSKSRGAYAKYTPAQQAKICLDTRHPGSCSSFYEGIEG